MNRSIKTGIFGMGAMLALLIVITSCESKDPSMLKVFVRNSVNDQLIPKAKVIIIGDTKSNPPTKDFVDTLFTDDAGVATFNMGAYFDIAGKDKSGYFDILVKNGNDQTTGRTRIKEHITVVETVYF